MEGFTLQGSKGNVPLDTKTQREEGEGRQNSPPRHGGHGGRIIFTEDNEGNEGIRVKE
jgi:hypothetical protein